MGLLHPGLPGLFGIFHGRNLLDAPKATDDPLGSAQPVGIGPSVEHHLKNALMVNGLRPGEPAESGDISCCSFERKQPE
jgi:hypothetical protein